MSVPKRRRDRQHSAYQAQDFGTLLRYLRRRSRLTQAELARAVGYSREHLARLELGQRQPDAVVVTALFLEALDIEAEHELAVQLVQLARKTTAQSPEIASSPKIPSNIPAPLIQLIGRETALDQLKRILRQPSTRLLSLLGPPGVGKTRLAYQLAWEQRHAYADGGFVVELAGIGDVAFVADAIAQTLGVAGGSAPVLERLVEHLREGQRLLVLDNMEHVLPAARLIARLLTSAPGLTCITTSREPLQIDGEHEYAVQPLALPASDQLPTEQASEQALESLAHIPSIALFIERARAIRSDFALTEANAAAVSTLCMRLDGLPLAIELAAAQIKLMTAETIMLRLTRDGTPWLGMTSRTRPERQRTLEAAISWSYQLMSSMEQRCFARLGVFRGMFDEAAARAIWNDESEISIDALPMLRSLVDKSLLGLLKIEGPYFGLLETLREYAYQRLNESGEYTALSARHAKYFADFVEHSLAQGLSLQEWLDRLEAYHDNLRAALQWAFDHADYGLLLKLTGLLGQFWSARGYHSEGLYWLHIALASPGDEQADRARALWAVAQLSQQSGMFKEAQQLAEQSLALYEVLNDQPGMARTLHILGWAAVDGSAPHLAQGYFEQELALQRIVADERGIAHTLTSLAYVLRQEHAYEQMQSYLAESIQLCRSVGDLVGIAFALSQQASLYVEYDDYPLAAATYQESLALYTQLGLKRDMAWLSSVLGEAFLFQRQLDQARTVFQQAAALFEELGSRQGIVGQHNLFGQLERYSGNLELAVQYYQNTIRLALRWGFRELIGRGLTGLGAVALARNQGLRGTSLLGAAKAYFERVPPFLAAPDQREFEELCHSARSGLDEQLFARAWAAGMQHAEELAQSCI